MSSKVPALVISERDAVMYEMKKSGASYRQIAKHFDISESTAHRGVARMQTRISERLALEHTAEARMDVERMDDILRSILPMTKQTKIVGPDGNEIPIPPSMDAVDRVLKIIAMRSKIMGYDKGESLTINVNSGLSSSPSTEKKDSKSSETTPEDEVLSLIEVFGEAGVLDPEALGMIKTLLKSGDEDEEILEAEIIETDPMASYDPVAIDPVKSTAPSDEPPDIVDDYDEEFPDG